MASNKKASKAGRTKHTSRAQRANDGFAGEPTPGHVQRSQQATMHMQTWRPEQPGGRERATRTRYTQHAQDAQNAHSTHGSLPNNTS